MNERIHNLLTLCMESKVNFEYWPGTEEIEIFTLENNDFKARYIIKFDSGQELINQTITDAENYLKEVITNAST